MAIGFRTPYPSQIRCVPRPQSIILPYDALPLPHLNRIPTQTGRMQKAFTPFIQPSLSKTKHTKHTLFRPLKFAKHNEAHSAKHTAKHKAREAHSAKHTRSTRSTRSTQRSTAKHEAQRSTRRSTAKHEAQRSTRAWPKRSTCFACFVLRCVLRLTILADAFGSL